jgi:type II secretory pathway pseudopilin PulG
MTLIEVMSALLITGLMTAAGAGAFASIVDRRQSIVRASAATEHAAALRETLRQWLIAGQIQVVTGGAPRGSGIGGTGSGAASRGATAMAPLRTVTPGGNSTGVVGVTAAVAAGDEIDFTTVAPNPSLAPTATMRLFVDGDASTPETGLTLEYQASTQSPLQRRQLDASITAIAVEYLDRQTGRWLPASELATAQPRALRLTLTPADTVRSPGLLKLPIVIPMPGAATTVTGQ